SGDAGPGSFSEGEVIRRRAALQLDKLQAERQEAVEDAVQGGLVKIAGQYRIRAVIRDLEICEDLTAHLAQRTRNGDPVLVHRLLASVTRAIRQLRTADARKIAPLAYLYAGHGARGGPGGRCIMPAAGICCKAPSIVIPGAGNCGGIG